MVKKNLLMAGFLPLLLLSSFSQAKMHVAKNDRKAYLSLETGLQLSSLGTTKKSQKKKKNYGIYEICTVPVVLDKPGKWFVKRELIYNGSGSAILITADGVSVDFLNHDLVLTDPAATGVYAQGVREIVIKNDAITTPAVSNVSTSNAILLQNCQKVTIENVFTSNTFGGVGIQNSSDVHLSNCHFSNNTGGASGNGSAVYAISSDSIALDGCVFEGTTGNTLTTSQALNIVASFNVRVSSCSFNNCDTALEASNNTEGILFEDSQVNSSPTNSFNMVQLGASPAVDEPATPVFNVTVRNSSFFNPALNNAEFDAFTAPSGSGLLLDNVTIDAQARGDQFYPVVAGLHIGQDQGYAAPASFNNVIVRNSLIKNANDNGIVCEANSSGILVENVNIEQTVVAGIHFYGSSSSSVNGSLIGLGQGNGIVFDTSATALTVPTAISIVNNTISSNGGNGVLLNAGSANTILGNTVSSNGGVGVQLNAGTTFNAVQNNVLANDGAPLNDLGTGNVTSPNQVTG